MSTARTEPQRLGPYRLAQRIGEGGMGVVYLAVGPDGDLLAVKVLRPWLVGSASGRQRLAREVNSLRRVRGPWVAEVLGADVAGDPPYVVTRYIPGPSLDKVVTDHGPLRGEALRRLGNGLAAALATVHAAGVVHRDVKPGNVLLHDGQPVLIDFGLAWALDETRLTATDVVIGTPGYLAPETVDGREATPLTDVHGWAATLAYAATGRPPYGAGPPAVVLDRIRRGEYDLADVEPWLAALLRPALSTDPQARPSVSQLQHSLESADQASGLMTARASGTPFTEPPTVTSQGATPPGAALPAATKPGVSSPGASPPETTPPGAAPPGAALPGAALPGAALPGAALPDVSSPDATMPIVGGPPTRVDLDADKRVAPLMPNAMPLAPNAPAGQAVQPPGPMPNPRGAARPAPAWPVGRQPPAAQRSTGRGPVLAVLVSLGALLVGVGLVAPYVGLGALAAVLVVGRAAWRARLRLQERRMARGPQRSDNVFLAFGAPWHALASLLPTAVQLGFLILVGLAVRFVAERSVVGPRAPLVIAGLVVVLVGWFGPGARRVRRGGEVMLGSLRRYRKVGWALAALLMAAAWAAGMWWESFGTTWWPSDTPPWP